MDRAVITFHTTFDRFKLKQVTQLKKWIEHTITAEKKRLGQLTYFFCDDAYLLGLNQKFLNHDTLTDIITFDYSSEKNMNGDIFISIERVKENAVKYAPTFEDELHRVMIHGVLHLLGYRDKTIAQKTEMTEKENFYLAIYKSKKIKT